MLIPRPALDWYMLVCRNNQNVMYNPLLEDTAADNVLLVHWTLDRVVQVWALNRVIVVLGKALTCTVYVTLTVPFSTQEYKRPGYQQQNAGEGDLRWTSIPSKGSSNTRRSRLRATCMETGIISSGSVGQLLAWVQLYQHTRSSRHLHVLYM